MFGISIRNPAGMQLSVADCGLNRYAVEGVQLFNPKSAIRNPQSS